MYLLQMYLNCIPVLVSEGYKAPFIGFIKSGTCHVLRQVEVKGTLPNGAEVRMVIFVTLHVILYHWSVMGVGVV